MTTSILRPWGCRLEAVPPEADPLLRQRATEADTAARLRIQTITLDSVGAKSSFTLTMQVGRPTLMPQKVDVWSYELVLQRRTPAYALIQAQENQLRQRLASGEPVTFIGFVRRFASDAGAELHWHLTADTPEVASVIEEIAVLEEVAGQELE